MSYLYFSQFGGSPPAAARPPTLFGPLTADAARALDTLLDLERRDDLDRAPTGDELARSAGLPFRAWQRATRELEARERIWVLAAGQRAENSYAIVTVGAEQ